MSILVQSASGEATVTAVLAKCLGVCPNCTKKNDFPGKLNPPESFFNMVPLDNGGTSGELWNFQALIQVQVLKARALP